MKARVHLGVAFAIAAVVGVAACSSGKGEEEKKPTPTTPGVPAPPGTTTPGTPTPTPTPTPPGRGRGQGTPIDCYGPSNLDEAAREQTVGSICSEHRARGARHAVMSRCESAFGVRSDAEIAGLLSAWNSEVVRQADAAEHEASDPDVVGLAHLVANAHDSLDVNERDVFRRLNITPAQSTQSRSLGGGLHSEFDAVPRGDGFDRLYVARLIEQQNRGLMLADALGRNIKNADLKGQAEALKILTEAEIDQACWIWSGLTGTGGRATKQSTPSTEDSSSTPGSPADEGGGDGDCQ